MEATTIRRRTHAAAALSQEEKAELGRKMFGSWEGPETAEELIAIMEGDRHSHYGPEALD